MLFFPRANQVFKTCIKTYRNDFHGNHFWAPSKSFSCAVNHFQTWSKWFFTEINDFFSAKNSKKWFFVAVNHLLKIISKWKCFFLTGNAHFQNVGNHFCENHFQCSPTKKHILVAACGEWGLEIISVAGNHFFVLRKTFSVSLLRWNCHNNI